MQAAEKYEAVIGLEIHAQLNTVTKAFSSESNSFGAEPNQNVSVVSLGHPGSLPRLNGAIVEKAIRLGLATHSKIAARVLFCRKNYFYTDLPKGYQISQHESPVCEGGYLMIRSGGKERKIRLTRIHIEEDAGKSIHDLEPGASCIDLNRAGVPLLEIVSEPDLASGQEAQDYIAEIRRMVRYLDVCDGNMEEGSLRCDANVSVRLKNETRLGTRTEIKNLNSMNNVRKAIEIEVKRQIRLIEKGEKVIQQTVSYDDRRNLTFPLRSKEEADDYRYFPEPDLNPLEIPAELVDRLRAGLPALPKELYEKFTTEFGISDTESEILVESSGLADYYTELAGSADPKTSANWILGPVKSWMNEHHADIEDFPLEPGQLGKLINLTGRGVLSYTAARQKLFPALVEEPGSDPEVLARKLDLIRETGEDAIMKLVRDALDKYPEKVKEFHNGKKGLSGLFMGEVMKGSGGKADPATASRLIIEELNKRKLK